MTRHVQVVDRPNIIQSIYNMQIDFFFLRKVYIQLA